jgi:Uma2 family endonuclease
VEATAVSADPFDVMAAKVLAELESLDLITDDGVPLETIWHRKCINLLVEQVEYHLRDRDDFYVGGNQFIYFSPAQARNKDFRGPDFYYIGRTTRQPTRECWIVWDENLRTPDVVIELSSESTKEEDHNAKFKIYRDTLRVGDYFIYDPDSKLLEGWKLEGTRYLPIRPDEHGRLACDQLDLLLGTWNGEYVRDDMTWLRFYDRNGNVIPIPAEAERQRADAAEAELARLRVMLATQQAAVKNGESHQGQENS